MGAAIVLLVTLTISVVVVRTAAVALRHTGMPVDVARFQARSAFTGTGFATSETEAVVSHPVRRRVIGFLMLFGNIGLVTVLATFIVSFVATDNSVAAYSRQIFWLLAALAFLWFLVLNPLADRLMCRIIGWLLQNGTSIGQQSPTSLLQITRCHCVSEHTVLPDSRLDQKSLSEFSDGRANLLVLGILQSDGTYSSVPKPSTRLNVGDRVIFYGSAEDQSHAVQFRHPYTRHHNSTG